jgi:hypothetical protein
MVANIKASNIPVATIVEGKAMSCGALLFSYGASGYRFMDKHATIMIHDVSSGARGKIEEIKADAKDGAVDQCVHRCAGCALGMDGKATMPLQVGAYTMHFCKQACLDRYAKDAAGELAKLKVD